MRQQKDLAERLASLKGRDGEDSPLLKGRMRDLEVQQKEIREALGRLLDDIETHVTQIARRPAVQGSARSGARVRRGGAHQRRERSDERSRGRVVGVLRNAGTCRRAKGGRHSGKILEQDASDRQAARKALAVHARPGRLLGNTIAQLLGEAGYSPGDNGTGSGGGMSYRRSTLDNVGLYGQMAGMDPTMSGGQGRDANSAGKRDRRESIRINRPAAPRPKKRCRQAAAAAASFRQGIAFESELISSESRKSAIKPVQEKSR